MPGTSPLNYWEYRRNGSPIGSGIVESACKQSVTERLKLSGMRWCHAGVGQIMTLRSILLSQTWAATFRNALTAPLAVKNRRLLNSGPRVSRMWELLHQRETSEHWDRQRRGEILETQDAEP